MWRMPSGDRVLTDAEWEVFSDGLDMLLAFVREDLDDGEDDTRTGVPAFDRLTAEQQFALLADVATALRDPTVPMPRHTAANEGAVAAVVSTIEDLLASELDAAADPDPTHHSTLVRQHLLAVAAEHGWEGVPRLSSKKRDKWQSLVEMFEELILWDNDHALGDGFLDLPPEQAAAKQHVFGIPGGYYRDTPAEPGEKGLLRAERQIARLFGRPEPDADGLYPGLYDNFNDLNVGPLTPAEAGAWPGHPWVTAVRCTDNRDWDCSFAAWGERFRGRLPAGTFELRPAAPGLAGELPDDVAVVPFDGGWAVRHAAGLFWVDALGNGWADPEDFDEDTQPVPFETEADARAAYTQANRLYAERTARRMAATGK